MDEQTNGPCHHSSPKEQPSNQPATETLSWITHLMAGEDIPLDSPISQSRVRRTLLLTDGKNPTPKPMNSRLSEIPPASMVRYLFAFSLLALPASLFGQEIASRAPAEEEIVELSPFVIDASEDAGSYSATSSLAGTRLRTDLKDVASAISVMTEKFMTDTNSKNSSDLLVYATNTEVGGQGGTYVGQDGGAFINDGEYIKPVPNTRVRGLAEADNVRDFFLTDIPWDSYNVNRVDLQRGPNSILFGIGSPAGIINSGLNTASLQDAYSVGIQFGSFGTYRGTLDLNKVLMEDELAVRVSALYDSTQYKQDPAYRDDERIFAAVRWEPEFLKKNGMRGSFRANYENGSIEGINPRSTPPMDSLTPWYENMGQLTIPWQDSSDLRNAVLPQFNPYLGAAGSRIWDGQVVAFDHDSANQGVMFGADVKNWPNDPTGEGNNTVNGSYQGVASYNNIGSNLRLPGWTLNPYKAKSLTDPSVFDFYNNLLDGENKNNWNDFDAYNLNYNQTFFNNKLGFELAYDHQDSSWGARNFFAYDAAAISVDIMETFADGTPNPNLGRPMVIGGGGGSGSHKYNNVRDTFRATIFGELDFEEIMDSDSGLANILGRHVFTANYSQYESNQNFQEWMNWFVGEGYEPTAASAVRQASRDAITLTYLGDSIIGTQSPQNLNLPRITQRQIPVSSTIKQWDTGSRSFIDYQVPIVDANGSGFNDQTRPYTRASKHKDTIDSQVLVWQGYFLDGAVVPLVGYRKDTAKSYDAGNPTFDTGIVSNFNDPQWRLPAGPLDGTGDNGTRVYNEADGDSTSWGIVLRMPESWSDRLPWGLDPSIFYNESSNFQPDASRRDVLGNSLPSPSGDTTDYGFSIGAMDNKLFLKVNWYETSVQNATLSGAISGDYMIGAGEAWAQQAAVAIKEDGWRWPGSDNFGMSSSGAFLRWEPPTSGRVDPSMPFNGNPEDPAYNPYTQEAVDAQYAAQVASVDAWLANPPPEALKEAWGLTGWDAGSGLWGVAQGVVVSGDTVSKGVEIELTANPVPGWQISANASKTDAVRNNIGAAYKEWMEQRHADFQGPMGDIRIWGGGNSALDPATSNTIRSKFENEPWAGYQLATALEGSSVPELREWRFNVVTNYDFQEGKLKGANVGGSWRYIDSNVTGFPINSTGDGYNVADPFYGQKEGYVDLWVGYQFRIFDDKVNWRIQLNVRNIFGGDDLIPVSVQPDGSPAAYRIAEPMTWTLSNTFEF